MTVPVIVVIGGGFSGTVVAARLLRQSTKPLRVVLLNRSGPSARGVAYGTRSSSHVLNVPAGRMSAYPEDEDSFLRFARATAPGTGSGSFVPRSVYGQYLGHALDEAERRATQGVVLERVVGEALDIELTRDGAQVRLGDGRSIDADRVVLALGNYPPADPRLEDDAAYESPRYVRDPWAPGALEGIGRSEPVLMIGSGLTMLDVAVDLHAANPDRPLHAVSRRGLVPFSHREHSAPPPLDRCPPGMLEGPATAHAYLRTVRRHVRRLQREGVDWRDVVASLRSVTPALWQRLDNRERARFLRHVRPYWEVHRHRCAPELGAALRTLLSGGTLTVLAGRLKRLQAREAGLIATLQPRGGGRLREMAVGCVVNCTGPAATRLRCRIGSSAPWCDAAR